MPCEGDRTSPRSQTNPHRDLINQLERQIGMTRTKALRFWAAWKWVQQVRKQRMSCPTSPFKSSRHTAKSACCRRIPGIADPPERPCNGDIGTCSRIRDSDGSSNGAGRTTSPRQSARTLTRACSDLRDLSQPDCHVSVRVSSGALCPLLLRARALRRPKGACCPPLPCVLPRIAGLRGDPVLTAFPQLRVHVAGHLFLSVFPFFKDIYGQ